jgi:hypothetical protein
MASTPEEIERWGWYNGRLRGIARRIFLDRNAEGFKKGGDRHGVAEKMRQRIRNDTRPLLRISISHARRARDALANGDIALYERMSGVAESKILQAQIAVRQPFMEGAHDAIAGGAKGGRPPQHTDGELDALVERWAKLVALKQERNPAMSKTAAQQSVANDESIPWTRIRDAKARKNPK